MLLSAVSVFVVAQSSSEIPEGLMNNPVLLEFIKNSVREVKALSTLKVWAVEGCCVEGNEPSLSLKNGKCFTLERTIFY